MTHTVTITLVVDGTDADRASGVIDDLLDEGAIQDLVDERAGDNDLDMEITSAVVS